MHNILVDLRKANKLNSYRTCAGRPVDVGQAVAAAERGELAGREDQTLQPPGRLRHALTRRARRPHAQPRRQQPRVVHGGGRPGKPGQGYSGEYGVQSEFANFGNNTGVNTEKAAISSRRKSTVVAGRQN